MSVRYMLVHEKKSIWDRKWILHITGPFRWISGLRCECRTWHGHLIHIKRNRHILR